MASEKQLESPKQAQKDKGKLPAGQNLPGVLFTEAVPALPNSFVSRKASRYVMMAETSAGDW